MLHIGVENVASQQQCPGEKDMDEAVGYSSYIMTNQTTFTGRLRPLLLAALILVGVSTYAGAAINLLQNGDFSQLRDGVPLVWGLGPGGTTAKAGPHGERCLKIASPEFQYSMANQYIPMDGSIVRKVRFQGKVRYKGVRRGANSYDVLRAFIIWYDGKGRETGEYGEAGKWSGSGDWQTFNKELDVPVLARRAQVLVGLHESSGVCWFADVSLTVSDGDKSFQPSAYGKTDTHDWWPFTASECPAAGTPLDVSYLVDKPAGKHGFLTARDGHLFFQDGTRARFWGFDIMGEECFPDHETAERLADRLSRMGVNIMRLHHMDASWSDPNIFDRSLDDTQHLYPASMDKLDYFMAQLKKHGIYVYFDWLVNRHFKKGDGVADWQDIDDGIKIVAHYDPRIIELEKKYMAQVLDHKNAYTGIRYADEPQIALSEVINEDSLFYEDWYDKVPPRYLRELQLICSKYEPKADPAKHPFDGPTLRALYKIESGYYKEMRAYLKKLGLRCPTTGSNHWENIGPELLCDSETDYIDRHYYWDHPKDGFGWQQEFDNLPMIANSDESLPPDLIGSKVAGKPMVVTEWCFCWINDYIAEGPLVGAATACLQDWDVMIWFDISSTLPNEAMKNEFDIANKPHLFSQWPAAALMFYRQDLQPTPSVLRGCITRDDLLEGKQLSSAVDLSKPPTRRVEIAITDKKSSQAQSTSASGLMPQQETNWNVDQGSLTVKSPRTVALDGFMGGREYDFGWVKVRLKNEFAALWLTSLDGKPLSESGRILVTTASKATNTGMTFNPGRTHLEKQGTAPILIEPVSAELTFAAAVTCVPLAQNGVRGKPTQGSTLKLGGDRTFWYEITRTLH